MKNLILIIILALAARVSNGQQLKNDTVTIQTTIYCDHCKECETCQPHIERELSFAKGVKSSSVNVKSQTVTVIYNAKKTTPEAIKQAIAKAGYDADEIKAESKAVAKLDGCCKAN